MYALMLVTQIQVWEVARTKIVSQTLPNDSWKIGAKSSHPGAEGKCIFHRMQNDELLVALKFISGYVAGSKVAAVDRFRRSQLKFQHIWSGAARWLAYVYWYHTIHSPFAVFLCNSVCLRRVQSGKMDNCCMAASWMLLHLLLRPCVYPMLWRSNDLLLDHKMGLYWAIGHSRQ